MIRYQLKIQPRRQYVWHWPCARMNALIGNWSRQGLTLDTGPFRRTATCRHRPENRTGNLFGVKVRGLAVMALAFGQNGILYAVGDCNPDATAHFECTPGADPDYNSLYRVDENRHENRF